MLTTALTAVGGIAAIFGAWILVQSAWRRTFPGARDGEDVMDGRLGCRHCPREPACRLSHCDGPAPPRDSPPAIPDHDDRHATPGL